MLIVFSWRGNLNDERMMIIQIKTAGVIIERCIDVEVLSWWRFVFVV
jgi:hypothetical protein